MPNGTTAVGVRARMNLGDVISGLNVHPVRGAAAAALRVCDITEDSRTAVPGSLFVARAGATSDGRRFIPDAIRAGAVAVLTDDPGVELPRGSPAALLISDDLAQAAAAIAERFYGSPTKRLRLIGITGTNGKTTTAHLIHQMLNGAGTRCGLIGTVMVDDGRETSRAEMTTPPATELSRTFATMVENGCRAAAMEVSSHALDQSRVAALSFGVGIFTNLTGDHLDYHGTMEEYTEAKARLFRMLPPDGAAIVNAEDERAELMVRGCRAPILRCRVEDRPPFAAEGSKHCIARPLAMDMDGTTVEFAGPWGRFQVHTRLIGRHNVMNALQAVAACHAAGLEPAALAREIGRAIPPPGRLEPVHVPRRNFVVLVDYAHTDDALRQALTTLRPLVGSGKQGSGRLIVVFGCGGDRDQTKRPRMGQTAAELADLVFVTSDNPRTERPSSIIDQILRGIPGEARGKVTVDADRRLTIRRAVGAARAGDIVLIAGKGHETEQIVSDGAGGTRSGHFDDREAAREAIAECGRERTAQGA